MPTAPVRVPNQKPLAPDVTSVANDKGDIEIIPGAVDRSPGMCLTAKENSGKPQLGPVGPVIGSNEVSFFQMRSVAQHVRDEVGRKRRKYSDGEYISYSLHSSHECDPCLIKSCST